MSTEPTNADVAKLTTSLKKLSPNAIPPVHLWDPPYCGEIDMRIARDGSWHYQGSPIGRAALVRLFSSILKKEGDSYYLVTPVEKVKISVDDAPLFAIDFDVEGTGKEQVLHFKTLTDDDVIADRDHPLRFSCDPITQEPAPYIMVRRGLEALIDRKSFYRLVDLAVTHPVNGKDCLGLWSHGQFFVLTGS